MANNPSNDVTTGLGVAAKIAVAGNVNAGNYVPGYNDVFLSLSGNNGSKTFQLTPIIEDASGNELELGTDFVLSAAGNASDGSTIYTGIFTGATTGSLVCKTVVIAGFVSSYTPNNGAFIITANTNNTSITVDNPNGVAVSAVASATLQESTANPDALTYVSYSTEQATVSADGLITAVAEGGAVVEVSYPTFSNASGTNYVASGTIYSPGNPMNGLPLNKIYAEVNVSVGV